MSLLPRIDPGDVVPSAPLPVDADTLAGAAAIVERVREGGESAVRAFATELDNLAGDAELVLGPEVLAAAAARLPARDRAVLERTAARIDAFARAQRNALAPLSHDVPGGRAGHDVAPVELAGCYAPGGRYPLPSSVLMTAITAKAAGVASVYVCSPNPTDVTLAAAAIAGADGLAPIGGAHAIAALAFGAGPIPRCDAVVGPGNKWVTAAKQLVAGTVRIDMLAGPSELLVIADDSSDPDLVAADLLAQAEHDTDARPLLIALSPGVVDAVERCLTEQLADLPTADVARAALRNGAAIVTGDRDEAATLADRLAPEHLELAVAEPRELARNLHHYGALFIGSASAEVFGDYGIGPNHVLPTGGTARYSGGLSVLTFLRVRTWLDLDSVDSELARDAERLAELEGLIGHARAAAKRSR